MPKLSMEVFEDVLKLNECNWMKNLSLPKIEEAENSQENLLQISHNDKSKRKFDSCGYGKKLPN